MIHAELARLVVDARRRDLEREARADALIRASRSGPPAPEPGTRTEFQTIRPALRAR
ncbi:MAG TPA: hypothetical protein VH720_01960 [Candidatus Limnocylindrales bacterium]|jgi:hypothetical protein